MSATCSPIDCATLRHWLRDGDEIALLDVREHGQYGEGHPFFAVSLPYSRLELDIDRLAPCRAVRIVLIDDGDGVATRAGRRLDTLGYERVHRLAGGVHAWRAAGHALFAGVNVPSKAFGELVEQVYHTPSIPAASLVAMRRRGEPLIVLDGRPFAEYRKMSIPGAICCPNGELAYRFGDLVEDPGTTAVINCAGRTRSIIGAQTLIEMGVPNRVLALENGTQGWYLNDLALEHGSQRRYPANQSPRRSGEAREAAARLRQRFGVPSVDAEGARTWLKEHAKRSVYLCDVRSPEEFAAGTLSGAQSTPGGQLIQAFDEFVAVRNARLILFDDDGVRASVVAGWLRRLGHDASVLAGGLAAGTEAGLAALQRPFRPARPASIDPRSLAERLGHDEVFVIDLRSSAAFRAAHVPGSLWGIRPKLPGLVARHARGRQPVLIADEPGIASLAAIDLVEMGFAQPLMLGGGIAAWSASNELVHDDPRYPADDERIDFLFFAHDRHSGNKEAARQYLAWETQLLSQLDADEYGSMRLGQPEHEEPATHGSRR